MPKLFGFDVSDHVYQLNKRKIASPRRRNTAATPAQHSPLEEKFIQAWDALHGPRLQCEYQFHPRRKWRADFYHPATKTIIEIDGGLWMRGRHNRAQGYSADCEKLNAATMLGYRVIRLTSKQLQPAYLDRIIEWMRRL